MATSGDSWIQGIVGGMGLQLEINIKFDVTKCHFFLTLPETNIFATENGWLEYDRFLLGWPIFRGELLVSGSVHHVFWNA